MPPLLEIRGLVKRFDERTVLDGIDLVVAAAGRLPGELSGGATAYNIADRVVLLHQGRIALDGPQAEVLALDDDPRIAPFAASSGVDPSRIRRRLHRKSPAEIRAVWESGQRRAQAVPPCAEGARGTVRAPA